MNINNRILQYTSVGKHYTDCWIISGCKRQGQMKQEVRNVGKFSASTPSSGSNYLLYNLKVLKVLSNNQYFNYKTN